MKNNKSCQENTRKYIRAFFILFWTRLIDPWCSMLERQKKCEEEMSDISLDLFWAFLAQNTRTRFSSKDQALSLFKLDDILTLQKIRKLRPVILGKIYSQTEKQIHIHTCSKQEYFMNLHFARDYSFSTYVKVSKKLTFLPLFLKILRTYEKYDPWGQKGFKEKGSKFLILLLFFLFLLIYNLVPNHMAAKCFRKIPKIYITKWWARNIVTTQ